MLDFINYIRFLYHLMFRNVANRARQTSCRQPLSRVVSSSGQRGTRPPWTLPWRSYSLRTTRETNIFSLLIKGKFRIWYFENMQTEGSQVFLRFFRFALSLVYSHILLLFYIILITFKPRALPLQIIIKKWSLTLISRRSKQQRSNYANIGPVWRRGKLSEISALLIVIVKRAIDKNIDIMNSNNDR